MNLFRRLFPKKEPEDTQERLDRLEAEWRRMQEEWTDVYGKFRVLHMRVAKQAQKVNESSEEEPQAGERDSGAQSPSSLSPRLQKIQQEILARRGNRSITPKVGE
jgi:predicted nuclease with TOPRIM domain